MLNLKRLFLFVTVMGSALCISAGLAYADENKVGVVSADVLNVRNSASKASNVLTTISEGTQVFVVDSAEDWYKISIGDITGWVASEYISIGDSNSISGTIIGDNVNIRSGAGMDETVVTRASYGTKVSIVGRSDSWYNVQLSDGTAGWVYKDYITAGSSRSDDLRRQIVAFAKRFEGVRYVWGGNGPNGFDCSGFVKYVYNNFGITINRVAADQATQGTKISKADLKAGDLVFFDTDGGLNYINHVGIYIGNGSFIHASSGSKMKVVVSDLNGYSGSYMTARRFIR